MRIITELVTGPFKNEQEFKHAVLKVWEQENKTSLLSYTNFEIENEEKEPGMPDVLAICAVRPAYFIEFKFVGSNGVIEFQKSQPLFYKKHSNLFIQILVWDVRYSCVVCLESTEVVARKALRFTLHTQNIKETQHIWT